MIYDIPPINHNCSYQCEIKHLDNVKKVRKQAQFDNTLTKLNNTLLNMHTQMVKL